MSREWEGGDGAILTSMAEVLLLKEHRHLAPEYLLFSGDYGSYDRQE